MAKNKNQEVKEIDVEQDSLDKNENKDFDKKENIIKSSLNLSTITYQGSVKVSLKKGNKTIFSKTYHNKGGAPLFNFLCSCLAGNYQEADRPKNIMLYTNDGTYSADNSDINSLHSHSCSTYISLNKVGFTADKNGVVLHFTVPCAFVNSDKIYQIGLFSFANSQRDSIKYSACWNFISDDSVPTWNPLDISSANGDYNIFVEWTMALNDKSTQSN